MRRVREAVPLLLCALCLAFVGAAPAGDETRGVGVYPGDPREDFAPALVRDDASYRNLALHRPAYHSSSYDYNLTAQLVTDGIVETRLPRWLATRTSRRRAPAQERARVPRRPQRDQRRGARRAAAAGCSSSSPAATKRSRSTASTSSCGPGAPRRGTRARPRPARLARPTGPSSSPRPTTARAGASSAAPAGRSRRRRPRRPAAISARGSPGSGAPTRCWSRRWRSPVPRAPASTAWHWRRRAACRGRSRRGRVLRRRHARRGRRPLPLLERVDVRGHGRGVGLRRPRGRAARSTAWCCTGSAVRPRARSRYRTTPCSGATCSRCPRARASRTRSSWPSPPSPATCAC